MDFTMNAMALCGIIPGLLIIWLKPRTAATLGGICIMAGQLLCAMMVEYDHKHIRENSKALLFSVCVLSGQGSIMVILACLQSLLNSQTIQSSAVVCTCIFSYYLGGDSFIDALKQNFLPDMQFTSFVTILAVIAFVSAVANGVIISDSEDRGGFFGKAEALSKGIVFKTINLYYLLILMIYTVVLIVDLELFDMKWEAGAIALFCLVLANLFVPLITLKMIDPDNIKTYMREPSEIEKFLSNKGEDKVISEAASRGDFWYNCFTSFIIIGGARMLEENAEVISLGVQKTQEEIEQAFLVFEVVGSLIAGVVLIFLRQFFRPSALLVYIIILQVFAFAIMIRPEAITFVEEPLILTVKLCAACEGVLFVAFGVFIHEEYGTEHFGLILSIYMTAGAIGLYILDEVFFANITDMFKEELAINQPYFAKYGKWNEFLFSSMTVLAVLSFFVTLYSHFRIKRSDRIAQNTLKIIEF